MLILAVLTAFAIQSRADSLTIEEALDRARVASPRARMAAAGVATAKGAFAGAGVVPNPVVGYDRDEISPTQKLALSQSFDWLLTRGATRARGAAGVNAARADSAQLMAELARDVRTSFFAALAAQEDFRIAQQQMAAMDTLAIFAERRLAAGDISVLERDQVALEVARWRQTLSRSRESVHATQIRFANVIASDNVARPRGSLDADLETAALLINSQSIGNADDLPLMRSALAELDGARAAVNSASLARIPLPGLVVGREWGELDPGQRSRILGFSLPVPLWSQGGPGVAEARARVDHRAAAAETARRDLTARLTIARSRLEETTLRARIARDSLVPMATRLRQSGLRLFESGRAGILSVFDSFRQERETLHTALEDMRAYQEARADALALLGRWR